MSLKVETIEEAVVEYNDIIDTYGYYSSGDEENKKQERMLKLAEACHNAGLIFEPTVDKLDERIIPELGSDSPDYEEEYSSSDEETSDY